MNVEYACSTSMEDLSKKAKQLRRDVMKCIAGVGVGHIGGALSIIEILTALYYREMNVDPSRPDMENRDRLILSKGHAGPALYAVLADKGYFPKEWLDTLNQLGTNLPSHCDMKKTPGVDMTTGSLGQGFSCAVGVALGGRIKKSDAWVYTIIGDGESQEGQIWEAAMYAAHIKLGNLIAFCDCNNLQIDGYVSEINTLGEIGSKWRSFGWDVHEINGHSFEEIFAAIKESKLSRDKPHMIICGTVKGKGVSFVEKAGPANHNMTLSADELEQALRELA